MTIEDKDKVYVLRTSDDAAMYDSDGDVHNAFTENRRFVVLSIPKTINLNAATTAARDLLEVVAEAMEGDAK